MPKRLAPTYLPGFRQDTQKAVAWSEDHFGEAAADRYAGLIQLALRDLIDEPTRPGTKSRPDLGHHAYVYHLLFSRDRVDGERVKAPRQLRALQAHSRNRRVCPLAVRQPRSRASSSSGIQD